MPARVILEITSGPIQGETFEFDSRNTFLFGRRSHCQAQIKSDSYVSRHHFLLEANPPAARIRDLGSENGILVNGRRYGGKNAAPTTAQNDSMAVDLQDGDEIIAGQTVMQVRFVLPLICRQCGSEASETTADQASRNAPGYVCADCERVSDNRSAIGASETALICQRCGKNVFDEVQPGPAGFYICKECLMTVDEGSGGIRRLMEEARKNIWNMAAGAKEFEDYEIQRELGKGGMGIVCQACRKTDGQQVAIKLMLPKIAVSEHARNRFLREIELTRTVRHPNVVQLFESRSMGSQFFFVMEYCSGGSLADLMRRHGGKLDVGTIAQLFMQCLDGLEYAHRSKIVHRDLKPANILIGEAGGAKVAKLADLGLAKNFEMAGFSGLTLTRGGPVGTLVFMPREQVTEFKYVRPVSDIWSMAATFYNALTGAYPIDFPKGRDAIEVLLEEEAVPIRQRDATISKQLAVVIDRALSVDVKARYQSAAEMKAAIQKVL